MEARRAVVLRREEIERTDILQNNLWIRHCQITLGNGEKVALINAVGGNLSNQIRRRLLRSRKKHQHPDDSETSSGL